MNSVLLVALLALLAVTAQYAHAQDLCTDETCTSTVTVTQRFTSTDCTGNFTLRVGSNYTVACEVEVEGYNTTYARACSASRGFTQLTVADAASSSCGDKPTTTLVTAMGYCRQTGPASSTVLWCNQDAISDTFKPAKLPLTAAVLPESYACNITTGCTDGTGTLRTFTDPTCSPSSATNARPASAFENAALVIDTCYVSNSSITVDYDARYNLIATCNNGQFAITYSKGGCGASANPISTRSYPTDTCIRQDTNVWISFSCPASAPSPSDASALTIASGRFLFAIFIVAFLFI